MKKFSAMSYREQVTFEWGDVGGNTKCSLGPKGEMSCNI
jgi:hypothetical protein